MAEVGAKHADVEATSVAHAQDGLGIELIGNAETRRKRFVSVFDIAIRADSAEPSNIDQAVIQVSKTAVALGVDGFGEVHFPAQTVGQGEFGSNSPRVLTIKEGALLALSGV